MLNLVVAAVVTLLMASSVQAQTSLPNQTEWSAESRTVLAFRVNPAALQRVLPEGWTSAPSTVPATAGANLTVTFMERVVVLDPKGAPVGSGTARYAVMSAAARNAAGQQNSIIVGGMSTQGLGVYSVYVPAASTSLERTVTGSSQDQGRVRESWAFTADSGEKLSVDVTYRRGPATRTRVDSVIRSAAKPDFQRTYHIDQTTDIVRGVNVADRVDALAFSATGPAFRQLFDGTQALVAVTAIPYYVRDITVP